MLDWRLTNAAQLAPGAANLFHRAEISRQRSVACARETVRVLTCYPSARRVSYTVANARGQRPAARLDFWCTAGTRCGTKLVDPKRLQTDALSQTFAEVP